MPRRRKRSTAKTFGLRTRNLQTATQNFPPRLHRRGLWPNVSCEFSSVCKNHPFLNCSYSTEYHDFMSSFALLSVSIQSLRSLRNSFRYSHGSIPGRYSSPAPFASGQNSLCISKMLFSILLRLNIIKYTLNGIYNVYEFII